MRKSYNFALFGFPISRSISPSLYYYLYASLPYLGKYYLMSTKYAVDLREIFENHSIIGANVTAPLKTVLLGQLDVLTPEAQHIGAINTLTLRDGTLWGHNTDAEGISKTIEHEKLQLAGQHVLVLGAGGAARAMIYVLKRQGAHVYVLNRTALKAKSVAQLFDVNYIESPEDPLVRQCSYVFSTIPPHGKAPNLPWECFSTVVDSNYYGSPIVPPIEGLRIRYISGLQWLFYQAIATYEFTMQTDLRGYTFAHWREHGLNIPIQFQGDPQFDSDTPSSPSVSLIPLGLDELDSQEISEYERSRIPRR